MYVLHMYYAIHATMNYYYLTEHLHKRAIMCKKGLMSCLLEEKSVLCGINSK